MPAARNFTKVFIGLARSFSKAGEHLADLEDSLDTPVQVDQFNQRDKGNRARDGVTGPEQGMYGGKGAEKFVSDYSKDTDQSQALMQGYAAMADELASQSKRVESVEKSIRAIASFIAQSVGKADAAETFGTDVDEKDEDDDRDEGDDRKESSAKSGMRTLSIPKLMRELSGYSRSGGKGLATPPNLAVVKKGAVTIQSILDADANISDSVRIEVLGCQQMAGAVARGAVHPSQLHNRIGAASREAQRILRAAGIA